MVVRSGDVGAVAAKLARPSGSTCRASTTRGDDHDPSLQFEETDAEIFASMVKDLEAHRGSSVLMAGQGSHRRSTPSWRRST